MIPTEYDEMVRLIETWWGPMAAGPWQDSANFDLFADLQTDPIFETLTAMRDGGRYNDWPPKPPALRAAALDLIRNSPTGTPALPAAPVEAYDWAEYSKRTYGEVITLDRAVSLSAAAQDAGVPPPSPQNPWRRPEEEDEAAFMAQISAEDAPYEPFPPDPDPLPRDSRPDPGEPPEEVSGIQVVTRSAAKRAGGKCDHCRQVVEKGAPIAKVVPACCEVSAHQRPSRTSGGAGSWICQACEELIS